MSIRAVFVLDDGVHLVRRDGTFELLLAPGHPRPGAAHATAGAASSAVRTPLPPPSPGTFVVAEAEFEERVAEAKENGVELTTSRVLRGRPPAEFRRAAPARAPTDPLGVALERALRAYAVRDHGNLRRALEDHGGPR